MTDNNFPAARDAALARLASFTPKAGRAYASGRNTDNGPGAQNTVSKLSPYVRYRLVSEQDVVAPILRQHSFADAEKYVQEVAWRTYWKGWLEMRPAVWTQFVQQRDHDRSEYAGSSDVAAAEAGRTGIAGFDDWARELADTGYLHNHARMWFASIWIFTLRLPWTLGADFFLRHLLDADAASNTLSWRWVAGLQTAGKTYLATAENIARFTNGRFEPKGLATSAMALPAIAVPAAQPLIDKGRYNKDKPALLLVTHEDLAPESLFRDARSIAGVTVATDDSLLWGDAARRFVRKGADDAAARSARYYGCEPTILAHLDAATLAKMARTFGVEQIVTPYAPVGPVAGALDDVAAALATDDIRLVQVRRDWDNRLWPHATKGFFPFKEQLPSALRDLGII